MIAVLVKNYIQNTHCRGYTLALQKSIDIPIGIQTVACVGGV